METKTKSVDEVLAEVPEPSRTALQVLRETVRSLAPEAEEVLSYGVPAFKLKGKPFVSYGAAKTHCSFYVQSPDVMEAHASDLAGYKTSKGTVHFQPEEPLPRALIAKLVNARAAELARSKRATK